MTHEEIQRQKADVLLEFVEAEQYLSSLRVKIERYTAKLRECADLVDKAPATLFEGGAIDEKQLRKLLDADHLIVTMREYKDAFNKLRRLKEQKAALGL